MRWARKLGWRTCRAGPLGKAAAVVCKPVASALGRAATNAAKTARTWTTRAEPVRGIVTRLAQQQAAASSSTSHILQRPSRRTPGTAISRYGAEGGRFASPAGTPFSARGLPPGHEGLGESSCRVVTAVDVYAGYAAWWQGPGGGIQYKLPKSIAELRAEGVLKRLGE